MNQSTLFPLEQFSKREKTSFWELENEPIIDSIWTPTKPSQINPTGTIGEYNPGGNHRGDKVYFRFSYYYRGKTRHRHIRGGATDKPTAIRNKEKIQKAIDRGLNLEGILALLNKL